MHTRPGTIIAGGVVVAVLGALMVFAYGRSVEGKAIPVGDTAVIVATQDIAPGTAWEQAVGSFSQRKVPDFVKPSNAVTKLDALNGRKSVRSIGKGEVVTSAQFGAGDAPPASGLEIPPGHNAVTIDVPLPQGVARYPQPGDLVNVYGSFKLGEEGPVGTVTKLLLSNVQVLSVQTAGSDPKVKTPSAGSVLMTLALTPDAAERVIFSKENGSLWFGLVRPGDGPAATSGRGFTNVLR
jgi:Flp pilus assembly protein CpaB